MVPIGLIAIGSGPLGSYAVGGAAAGAFSIANAVGATLIGRAADERGHRPMLLRTSVVMAAGAVMISAVALLAPDALLLIAASALLAQPLRGWALSFVLDGPLLCTLRRFAFARWRWSR